MKGIRKGLALVLLVVLTTGCQRGCSCSPLARADDPRAFVPGDAALVLEMDMGGIGNHAIMRQVVMGLWEKGSCLVPHVLDDTRTVVVAIEDTRPDERTMPHAAVLLGEADPADILECVVSELFRGAGDPEEETYRDVRHFGYPERLPIRIAVVNERMLLVGDRASIHRMVDTFLDGMPSLATTDRFDEARALLPPGAQVRLVGMPGAELRSSARERLGTPWSGLLDAKVIAAGLVFGEGELTLAGTSRVEGDAAALAREGNQAITGTRMSKVAKVLGVSDLLADTAFDLSGKDVKLEARASAKTIEHFVKGAGQLVEIGL